MYGQCVRQFIITPFMTTFKCKILCKDVDRVQCVLKAREYCTILRIVIKGYIYK